MWEPAVPCGSEVQAITKQGALAAVAICAKCSGVLRKVGLILSAGVRDSFTKITFELRLNDE